MAEGARRSSTSLMSWPPSFPVLAEPGQQIVVVGEANPARNPREQRPVGNLANRALDMATLAERLVQVAHIPPQRRRHPPGGAKASPEQLHDDQAEIQQDMKGNDPPGAGR